MSDSLTPRPSISTQTSSTKTDRRGKLNDIITRGKHFIYSAKVLYLPCTVDREEMINFILDKTAKPVGTNNFTEQEIHQFRENVRQSFKLDTIDLKSLKQMYIGVGGHLR